MPFVLYPVSAGNPPNNISPLANTQREFIVSHIYCFEIYLMDSRQGFIRSEMQKNNISFLSYPRYAFARTTQSDER